MTISNVVSINDWKKQKRKEGRTLTSRIKKGMLALSAAGFIGSFGAALDINFRYNSMPEAVVQYQELERRLQRSVSPNELMGNPDLRNEYLKTLNEYERFTADQDRMKIVSDYNDAQREGIFYMLLAGAFEFPLVWGAAGYFQRRKQKT